MHKRYFLDIFNRLKVTWKFILILTFFWLGPKGPRPLEHNSMRRMVPVLTPAREKPTHTPSTDLVSNKTFASQLSFAYEEGGSLHLSILETEERN